MSEILPGLAIDHDVSVAVIGEVDRRNRVSTGWRRGRSRCLAHNGQHHQDKLQFHGANPS
jgi:hypothetical protein